VLATLAEMDDIAICVPDGLISGDCRATRGQVDTG
jgi:hypothetical protein